MVTGNESFWLQAMSMVTGNEFWLQAMSMVTGDESERATGLQPSIARNSSRNKQVTHLKNRNILGYGLSHRILACQLILCSFRRRFYLNYKSWESFQAANDKGRCSIMKR